MDIFKVIFISIVQGITEFLPISSSGHILLLKKLLNLELDTTFDIFIHMGTLLAVLIIYRNEIFELISGIFNKNIKTIHIGNDLSRKEILKIWNLLILATIPAGISGIFLDKYLDFSPSETKPFYFLLLAICFLITSLFLLSTLLIKNKKDQNISQISFFNAIIIGLFQSIAVLPGISRSGTTITGSLHVGLNKKSSAKFSFLLSIPIISAAFLLKIIKLIETNKFSDINNISLLLIGLLSAFIAGYFSLKILIKIIEKGKFWIFSIYLIIPITISIYLWLF